MRAYSNSDPRLQYNRRRPLAIFGLNIKKNKTKQNKEKKIHARAQTYTYIGRPKNEYEMISLCEKKNKQ